MSFDDLLARVAQITGAVDVPLSVDVESGYGETPQRLIDGLLSVGAVGLNIEDTVHKEDKRLRAPEEHAALIGELRKAADAAGVHVVTQCAHGPVRPRGRRRGRPGRPRDRAAEAGRRSGRRQPVPGRRHDDDTQRRLTSELPLPVNAIATARSRRPRVVRPAGRRAVSFGPFFQRALSGRAEALLARWK